MNCVESSSLSWRTSSKAMIDCSRNTATLALPVFLLVCFLHLLSKNDKPILSCYPTLVLFWVMLTCELPPSPCPSHGHSFCKLGIVLAVKFQQNLFVRFSGQLPIFEVELQLSFQSFLIVSIDMVSTFSRVSFVNLFFLAKSSILYRFFKLI